MLKAIEFEILRDVPSRSAQYINVPRCPMRLATLINEASFLEEMYLIHGKNVHFEDALHDWEWRSGKLRFYPRAHDVCDVLLVYVAQDIKFDPMTGEKIISIESHASQ